MKSKWNTVHVSEVAELSGGFAFKSKDYASEGRFILRTLNIRNDSSISRDPAIYLPLHLCPQYTKFELEEHDTLFVMVGATLGKIGHIRREDLPALLNQNMWLVRAMKDKIDPRYLHYAFRYVAHSRSAWASGSARSFVRRDDYRAMLIPYPPFSIQRRIVAILGALDDKIGCNRRIKQTLEQMTKALYKHWFMDFGPFRDEEFAESELGSIPKGWDVSELKRVCNVNARILRPAIAPPLIRYIDISSVSVGYVIEVKEMSFDTAPSRARRMVKEGDTVWSMVRPDRKAYFLALDPDPNTVVSTGFAVISPREVPFSWVYLTLTTDQFVNYLNSNATGAAYPAVTPEVFERAKLVLPPSEVLRKFHEQLEPLLRQISANYRQSQTLASVRDYLLPKLLSGEIELKTAEEQVSEVV